MIDIRLIRENKELVKENIKKKFQDHKLPLVDEVYDLDIQFREAKQEADQLRAEKNKKSAEIGSLMRDGKKDEAEKLLGNAVTLALIVGLTIMVTGLVFGDQILQLFGASPDSLVYAKAYINVVLLGTVFNLIAFIFNSTIIHLPYHPLKSLKYLPYFVYIF